MPRKLFILIISLLTTFSGFSQDIARLKQFADNQLDSKNYKAALKEYQRLLFFDTELQYTDTYSKIATLFYLNSDFDNALKYTDFALKSEKTDSVRFELVLQKALINFKQNNYFAAMSELYDLPETESKELQRKKNLFFGICHFGLNDYNNARLSFSQLYDSVQTKEVNLLFDNFEKFRKKYRPEKVEFMSMLLPGSGQVFTKHTASGLNSFLLLSGVSYYAYKTILNYGYLDGILILSSWFYRYYTGGYTNARNFAVQKIENEKINVYSELMNLSVTKREVNIK